MRRPSRSALFWVLMVVSAVLALLPAAWTRWLRGAFQLIGVVQLPVTRAVQDAREGFRAQLAGEISQAEARRLQAENEELLRLARQQQAHVQELSGQIAELSGVREALGPSAAKIILAPVAAFDADPRRESIEILKGTNTGVQVGMWVAAGATTAQIEPSASGRELLGRQWLIGRVTEAHPFVSRVLLTSDPSFRGRARAVRLLADGTWQFAEQDCLVEGRGNGSMRISASTEDYYAAGYRLVAVLASAEIPATMLLGTIESSKPVDDAPMHYNLEVRALGDVRRRERVYVVSPQ